MMIGIDVVEIMIEIVMLDHDHVIEIMVVEYHAMIHVLDHHIEMKIIAVVILAVLVAVIRTIDMI